MLVPADKRLSMRKRGLVWEEDPGWQRRGTDKHESPDVVEVPRPNGSFKDDNYLL